MINYLSSLDDLAGTANSSKQYDFSFWSSVCVYMYKLKYLVHDQIKRILGTPVNQIKRGNKGLKMYPLFIQKKSILLFYKFFFTFSLLENNNIYIYIYIYMREVLISLQAFFHIATFIDSTHMKLSFPLK